MKLMKLVLFTGTMAIALTIGLAAMVARATGCLQVPGPRCSYSTCADTGGSDCTKVCTCDPTVGFDACSSTGGSEQYCTDTYDGATCWLYEGTCNLYGTCLYGVRKTVAATGPFSQDTSPCGGG